MSTALDKVHTIAFDFDGVFTDNFLFVDENAVESVKVSRADGYAMDLLKAYIRETKSQISILIVSTEKNKVVKARATKLQIECLTGESNKLLALKRKYKNERPLDPDPLSGLVYFGNDLNDLPVILQAGVSFVPSDAHKRVKEAARYVLRSAGGHGFVREGVEFLLGIEAMSLEELREFISNC